MIGERLLVAVVGSSGIGKSSVVRAGLVPAVRRRQVREVAGHRHVPGSFPFELSAALLKVAVQRPASLVEELAAEGGMSRVVDQVLPVGSRLLLVIDQFEEPFTLTQEEETRTGAYRRAGGPGRRRRIAGDGGGHYAGRLPGPPAALPRVR